MLIVSLLFLVGCVPAEQACVDGCESDRSFWDACYDDFRENNSIDVYCYSDLDALGEALAAAGLDDTARAEVYNQWVSEEKYEVCADADAIVNDCVDIAKAEIAFLSSEAADEKEEECLNPEDSDIQTAMINNDCEGFLTALGM